MSGLMDIAPAGVSVPVGGVTVMVAGVSARGVVSLLAMFPELKSVLAGRKLDMTPADMLEKAPDAVAAIIALGCGHAIEDVAAIERAASLPLEAQLDLLDAVYKATMPQGFGPFVEKIGALGLIDAARSGNVAGSKSPQVSKPASQTDTASK